MEPANEPIPFDRLEPRARGGSMQGCVQAMVRATWRLQAVGDGVDLRAPDTATAVPLLADAIARYAAEQLEESRASIAPPDHGLVERLLAITGSVRIRPVETQVWAGFLEMGIGTDPEGRERPCETTLLYDRPSGTWHMEP